jgi:hypothetical protein
MEILKNINTNIIDTYNNEVDIENLLRILVRIEKCRMLEEGFIDSENNKLKNWIINDDLKPHKRNIENNDSDSEDEI